MTTKKILGLTFLSLCITAEVSISARTDASTRYEAYVVESGIQTVVTNNLGDFVEEVTGKVGGKPFTVYEYLGFSGADYANKNLYENDFEQAALQAVKNTKAKYGASAKTVFLLGGTVDGFGAGYKIIDGLMKQGKLFNKDVIVGGLVSDAAVGYHFEGKEKGWGDVLSPYQDVLLLMDVYKEPGQTESWELRTKKNGSSATIDVLKKLAASPNARLISLELFEGGEQATKETREFFQQLPTFSTKVELRVVLRPDYLPKKAAKLKGAPAATTLAADPMVQSKEVVFVQPAGSSEMFTIKAYTTRTEFEMPEETPTPERGMGKRKTGFAQEGAQKRKMKFEEQ